MAALSLTNGWLLLLTCVVAQTMEKLASVSVRSMEKLDAQNRGSWLSTTIRWCDDKEYYYIGFSGLLLAHAIKELHEPIGEWVGEI
jgi:hypothetical protein